MKKENFYFVPKKRTIKNTKNEQGTKKIKKTGLHQGKKYPVAVAETHRPVCCCVCSKKY